MKKTPKQCEEELRSRQEFAHQIRPERTEKEEDEYKAERKKHEEFDKKQEDPKRLTKSWREFAEKHRIKPENLFIGTVPDEDELNKRGTAWLKRIIEKYEPIYSVKRNNNDTITLTINLLYPNDLICHELCKVLKQNLPSKKGRYRKEHIGAIMVWKGRKLRKPFKQIAKEENIKEPACKKRFYKAYELVYDKKYDPAYYEKPQVKKEYLKKTCNSCKERPTCKDPCPDIIAFVEQDTKNYQREILS